MEEIPASELGQTPDSVRQLLTQLMEEMGTLRAEVKLLREENDRLRKENLALRKENDELRERLNLNPRNSSLPPSSEHPHAKPDPPPDPDPKQKKRKRGGQKGHPKHERTLIPTDECQQMVPCIPGECACCGEKLSGTDPDPDRHQVWDVPEVKPQVTEYQQHTLTCLTCGSQTKAGLPEGTPEGQFGPQVIALVALLSGQFRQSKRQVREFLQSVFCFPISLGQVCRLQQRASEAIAPAYEELRQALPRSDVINLDETPWKEDRQRLYLWGAETPEFSVFQIDKRTKEVAQNLLEGFTGVLGTDRFGSYDWVNSQQRQLCWAHLLRDFQGMIDRGGESLRVGEGLQATAVNLFRQWHRLKSGEIQRATFRHHVIRFQGEVYYWLEEGIHHCDQKKTAGQCQHIWERFDSLWVFAGVEGVEPTNNAAERVLRRAVIWRKLSFGTQSDWGSRFVERMLSVIETCRKQSRDTLSYLADCIQARFARKQATGLL